MTKSELSGKAQTVLGPVAPEHLGVTLPHEHLFITMKKTSFVEPQEASEKYLAYQPVSLEILGWLRMNSAKNLDNGTLDDEETAIDEVMIFKKNGGGTIVEVTPKYMGRDPLALARVSRATGINIVMGTSYYLAAAHPAEMESWTERQIADEFIKEIREGVEDKGVRAGIIGEVACSSPLHKNERKVLRAAAMAQRETGAPLMIHPGKDEESPLELIGIARDAGADASRIVMCHTSVTMFKPETRLKVAEMGCYIEYDLFGKDSHYYSLLPIDMPGDRARLHQIKALMDAGHERQILMSHDVCFKIRLTKYGGLGYGYILRYGVPMMRQEGFSEEQINNILIENPRSVLTFA